MASNQGLRISDEMEAWLKKHGYPVTGKGVFQALKALDSSFPYDGNTGRVSEYSDSELLAIVLENNWQGKSINAVYKGLRELGYKIAYERAKAILQAANIPY